MTTKVILAALMSACPLLWAHAESVVALKSGEVLQGEILSDTNGTLQIRAFSANRTYSVLRSVSDSDVKGIHEETSSEATERTDYQALSGFQLNPDQEQTVEWYNQWIGAFQKFVRVIQIRTKSPSSGITSPSVKARTNMSPKAR